VSFTVGSGIIGCNIDSIWIEDVNDVGPILSGIGYVEHVINGETTIYLENNIAKSFSLAILIGFNTESPYLFAG